MHFVCENDDTDAKFFQRPHGECKKCAKLSRNASIVQLSCKLYNSKVYTEFRIYRKQNIQKTEYMQYSFDSTRFFSTRLTKRTLSVILGVQHLVMINATVAQLVEQLICNQQVVGSSPISSSKTLDTFSVFAILQSSEK